MKTIPAAKFKAQCLSLLRRLTPEGIVITKRGKPVARLVAIGNDSGALIGSLKGKLRIKGNLLSVDSRPARRTRRVAAARSKP